MTYESPETVPFVGIHTEASAPAVGASPALEGQGSAVTGGVPSLCLTAFTAPFEDETFFTLPHACRAELRALLLAFQAIWKAGNKEAAIRTQASRLGLSVSRLRTRWFAFKRNPDWRSLVNKAKAGPDWWRTSDQIGLPREFIEFWKMLCESDQRTCKGAHRELLQIWRTGIDSQGKRYPTIPGYDAPQADQFTGIPRGWSFENLCRYLAASPSRDYDLTASRQGRAAAYRARRQVFTSRENLAVGQFILFDDQWYDILVNFAGAGAAQRKAIRPLGFNALDLASACSFAFGFRPRLEQADGTNQQLNEKEFRWFVVHVLTAYGFNPETGTRFIVERGTAAIRSEFADRIRQVTGGKVVTEPGGVTTSPAFQALFESAAKGSPRYKAPIESFFHLVRNSMAMLPGATGKDRQSSPEELAGRNRYNESLLRAAARLTPERAALLRYPFLSWEQFGDCLLDLYRAINSRTDHELQGWARNVTNEFRLPNSSWVPLSFIDSLAPEARAAAVALIQADPAARRTRKLSPHEVWTGGATRLQKLASHTIPDLLGPESGCSEPRRIRNGYITIEDQTFGTDPLRYPAEGLPSGEYQVYLNPFSPAEIVLADQRHRYVATLALQHIPSRDDLSGVHRQMAAAQAHENEMRAQLGLRHIHRTAERAALHQHNAQVLSGQPVTAAQRERAAEIRENIASLPDDSIDSLLAPLPASAPNGMDDLNERVDDLL